MKSIFIAYDQAQSETVQAILSRSNARGFTMWEQAQGCGSKTGDPHLGSHAWPTMNSAILTVVDDSQVAPILERLREADEDNPMLGIRAFVWNIEQSL
jgi:nitrogen regulatory protein PII